MTISAQIRERAAQIKAERKAGIVPADNNVPFTEKVKDWQDKTLRSLDDVANTAQALAEARKADGVRPLHKSLWRIVW